MALPQVLASAPTKSPARSAPEAWARSIKARDTRLDRTVAIKVLPELLAERFHVPRAIRPRGARDLGAESSAHLHAARRRPEGRPPIW